MTDKNFPPLPVPTPTPYEERQRELGRKMAEGAVTYEVERLRGPYAGGWDVEALAEDVTEAEAIRDAFMKRHLAHPNNWTDAFRIRKVVGQDYRNAEVVSRVGGHAR